MCLLTIRASYNGVKTNGIATCVRDKRGALVVKFYTTIYGA